jgi:hypothetical protein
MKHTLIISFGFLLLLSSCLGIPEDYEYVPSNKSNEVNMTAWDFIKSRPDVFSEFRDVVRSSGIDSTLYYSDSIKYTYLILDNNAMSSLTALLGVVSPSNKSNWINLLKYHIIDGYYHGIGVLNFDPTSVITLWRSQDAYMTLQLESRNSFNYSRLIVNGLDPAWTALTSTYKYAVTSNLMCTNAVCHVLNRHARPTTNNTFN